MATPSSDVLLAELMTLHPKIIDLTLDRVYALLGKLGNPHHALAHVVHIAGTNGKGSTLAMIRAGLEGAGHVVHAYTSPHLAWFHERIRLGGALITEEALRALLQEVAEVNGSTPITYFEITTVAALLAFSRSPADYTLLEVGLGGRLDATNVIDAPALSVITPISLDHQQYLGDTLGAIAAEKAGILKRNCFGVIGRQEQEALEVIEEIAARVGATLKIYGQHWHAWEENGRLIYQDEYGLLDLPLPALLGAHQIENAGMAVASLRLLGKDEAAISAAMQNVTWPARLERLETGALVERAKPAQLWLDGGHNPAAGEALAHALSALPKRPLHLIIGMLNTKDIRGYLRPLIAKAASITTVSIPGESATLSASETAEIAGELGATPRMAPSVEDAIDSITREAPEALILIGGSLYLAGHVLRANNPRA